MTTAGLTCNGSYLPLDGGRPPARPLVSPRYAGRVGSGRVERKWVGSGPGQKNLTH